MPKWQLKAIKRSKGTSWQYLFISSSLRGASKNVISAPASTKATQRAMASSKPSVARASVRAMMQMSWTLIGSNWSQWWAMECGVLAKLFRLQQPISIPIPIYSTVHHQHHKSASNAKLTASQFVLRVHLKISEPFPASKTVHIQIPVRRVTATVSKTHPAPFASLNPSRKQTIKNISSDLPFITGIASSTYTSNGFSTWNHRCALGVATAFGRHLILNHDTWIAMPWSCHGVILWCFGFLDNVFWSESWGGAGGHMRTKFATVFSTLSASCQNQLSHFQQTSDMFDTSCRHGYFKPYRS